MDVLQALPARLAAIQIDRRFALDVASVVSGTRPRALLHLPDAAKFELNRILTGLGLVEIASRTLYRTGDPASRESILCDSCPRDERACESWVEVWFQRVGGYVPSASWLLGNPGEALGYPTCCVNAFTRQRSLSDSYRRYLTDPAPGAWEVNRLATIFSNGLLMPDFFPCSLACDSARKFAIGFDVVARSVFSNSLIAEWRRMQRAVYTIIGSELVCWPEWNVLAGRLRVDADHSLRVPLVQVAIGLPPACGEVARLIPLAHVEFEGDGPQRDLMSVRLSWGEQVSLKFVRPTQRQSLPPQEGLRRA